QALLRIQRCQLAEVRPVAHPLRVDAVDGVETHQRVELLPALTLARLPDGTRHDVALAQRVTTYLGERDVDVVGARQIALGADERVVVEDVDDAGDRDEDVVLGDDRLGLARTEAVAPAAAAVALAEPSAPPAAAGEVVVACAGCLAGSALALAGLTSLTALAILARALLALLAVALLAIGLLA